MLLELARWQFAFTTVIHFIFVPLTIGLSGLVAVMQTKWVRTGNGEYKRMTKFWGKLLLVNFAIGIATGIVQEFQFGMAWSAYSRYVGDVFGAPLAMEGLAAFFLESTFLGLWIFGWDHLPKKLHLVSIWLVFLGTTLSAYFILAANGWMQHPVGYRIDAESGNAVLTSIWAVLSSSTAVFAFLHTVPAAILTAGGLVVGISIWHLSRRPGHETAFFRRSADWGLRTMLVTAILTMVIGHFFGQHMTNTQPMKMAAAEALYDTEKGAGLSLLTLAPFEKKPDRPSFELKIPKLASFIATDHPNGTIRGINDLQAEAVQKYGPGEYYPVIGLTYWSFRLMMGFGIWMLAFSAAGLLVLHRSKLGLEGMARKTWFRRLALFTLAAGFLGNAFGWIFTEVGRQPWVVNGLLKTEDAISKLGVSTMVISLSVFVVLYLIICYIEFRLFARVAVRGPEGTDDPPLDPDGPTDLRPDRERVPALSY
jgi:cytochrome d ubiquinol oxidase subunit I